MSEASFFLLFDPHNVTPWCEWGELTVSPAMTEHFHCNHAVIIYLLTTQGSWKYNVINPSGENIDRRKIVIHTQKKNLD